MIYLRLLGGASIERDGAPLAGSVMQRRRLALLAVLASARPASVTRERLASYLSPDADQAHAHHALSDALHAVRKALGRDVVVSAGDSLSLGPGIASDVGEFTDRLAAGDLEAGVSIYRGPFLDGFFVPGAPELERWIEVERARLAARYAEATEALATAAERSGDRPAALGWWRAVASHDPYSSRIAMRLADTLVAAGDPAGALRQLHHHLHRLREDLGIEPDPDVRTLIARLQAEVAQPVAVPRDARPSVVATASDSPGSVAPNVVRTAVLDASADRAPRRWWPVAGVFAALVVFALWRGASNVAVGGARAERIDPTARALYLRGRQAWGERTREGLDQAVAYFREATERDPDYAAAYAGLADAYVILGYLGFRPAAAMFAKGKATALHAIELDSTLAEAYAPLGQALMWEHDWLGAERALRRAIELGPSYATAHQWYGILLCALGRMPEAVEHTARANELDPLSRQISNTYGMFLHYAGHSGAALRHYRAVVEAEPDSAWVRQNPWLLSNASRVYAANGLYDDALTALGRALAVAPRHPRLLWDLASTYVAMGHPERALATFAAADTTSGQYPFFRASVFAVVGERDSAFYWLDRVTEWGPSPVAELHMDPRLSPIRGDPRYRALLRRLRVAD